MCHWAFCITLFFFENAKILVGRTTLNREKKGMALAREKRKNAYENAQKNSKTLKPSMNNVVSTGMNFVKPWLSMCHLGGVRFARYCGQMYGHHLFSNGGLKMPPKRDPG